MHEKSCSSVITANILYLLCIYWSFIYHLFIM
jgi:hypothetical protein